MKGLVLKVIPAMMVIALAMFQPIAHAEGKCKGLSKSACEKNTSCSWVKGYKTSSGKDVSAYCRVKSGKKKTTDNMTNDSKKSKDKANKQSKEKQQSKEKVKKQEKKQSKEKAQTQEKKQTKKGKQEESKQ